MCFDALVSLDLTPSSEESVHIHRTRHRLLLRITLLLLAVSPLASVTLPAAESAPTQAAEPGPVFVYSFTGNPGPATKLPGVLGPMVSDLLVDFGERPNKPLLTELNSVLDQSSRQQRLAQAFSCAFNEPGSDKCRKVEFLSQAPFGGTPRKLTPSDELASLLQRYPDKRVWVLHLTEQFHVGGYFLSAGATETFVDAAGNRQFRVVTAMYAEPYSNRLDALSRGLPMDARDVTPRLGSKEARALYWLGGSPRRLDAAVLNGPRALADLLTLMKDLPLDSKLVSTRQAFDEHPKLGELRSKGEASCSAAYCGTRVFRDLGDRLYLEADWQNRPWLISAPRWGL
jgi:hypothetical protein